MSTIPAEQAGRPESAPHQQRQVAESFGTDAGRYDRTRPRYPDALVERIVEASPGLDVLDVGTGTGIAGRQFQAAGCRVLGVDPDARMAEQARRHGLEVEVATFEAWDPAGRTFDTVIAAQAWHWVDPDAGAAKAARALRPGGRLAVFWNVFQPPPEAAEAFSAVYRRVMPGSPVSRGMAGQASYSALSAKAADAIQQAGAFGDPEQWQFGWDRPYTRDEWLDQVPTFGGHGQLRPAELGELLTGIGAAIDAMGGTFTCTTARWWSPRREAHGSRRTSRQPPISRATANDAYGQPRAPNQIRRTLSVRSASSTPFTVLPLLDADMIARGISHGDVAGSPALGDGLL